MRDIMGMMGKVKEMQAKMEKAQAEIAALEVEGKAGGGLVAVILNGKGELKSLRLILRSSRKTMSRSSKT